MVLRTWGQKIIITKAKFKTRLTKDEADAKKWKFDRIRGFTGNPTDSFIPSAIETQSFNFR